MLRLYRTFSMFLLRRKKSVKTWKKGRKKAAKTRKVMEGDLIEAVDLLKFPEFRRNSMRTAQNMMSKIRKKFGLHRKQYPNAQHVAQFFRKYGFTPDYVHKYISMNKH